MRNHRRSMPWIYRWSRVLISATATLGSIDTAYLTYTKLQGGSVACLASVSEQASSTCTDVLATPYASVFGLPLALFGLLAYGCMAVFALAPLAVSPENNKDLYSNLENWTWWLLFAGATAMTVFSGYLMYLLAFELKTVCIYCIASAAFSFSLLVLTLIGRPWENISQLFFGAIVVGMVVWVSTLGVYAQTNSVIAESNLTPVKEDPSTPFEPTTEPVPGLGWEITHPSSEAEIALASHLKEIGAKMYGAYWCPHCYEQKQLFGREAFSEINYIECASDALHSQTNLCKQAEIKGYPTWEINGKKTSGLQDLEQLAKLSDYQGPRNFRYLFPHS